MRIIFANYHSFESQSAIHIFNLANELCRRGHECFVCVPFKKEDVGFVGQPAFTPLTFEEALAPDSPLIGSDPDRTLVHAWTPRENVRAFTLCLAKRLRCSYVVHLEDNEEAIVARNLGMSIPEIKALPPERLDGLIGSSFSHPIRYREFLAEAVGVTALMDRLLEFKPEEVPGVVFWPACEEELFTASPSKLHSEGTLRKSLGLDDSIHLVVYPGNAHKANCEEVFSLYLAIALVNRRGLPTRLVRVGSDFVPVTGELFGELMDNVIELGFRPPPEIPGYLAQADALVQPGGPDEFNDFRFPSKLTVFFAMGKPILLPRTNIGRYVTHGREALVLTRGDALEIADGLMEVFRDHELAGRLATNARAYAEEHFRWSRAASIVEEFYAMIHPEPAPEPEKSNKKNAGHMFSGDELEALAARYVDFPVPGLGYATVRDYCESMDNLRPLAHIHQDLKDVQRPWMFKSLLALFRPGAKLLEIGAGDPFVADLLTRLGYKVLIVDPYDGCGQGPTEFERIKAAYPKIDFFRSYFDLAFEGTEPGSLDGIYSISVLEHVPNPEEIVQAMARFLKPDGGTSIHAVDHVLRGFDREAHAVKLKRLLGAVSISEATLDAMLSEMAEDLETYYLSPFGHYLWRGDKPYDKFPMRHIVSVNFSRRLQGGRWV
jgi:glycosyltransferase involved in cell wall biosynthesis/2-polyprenyl-3-methyl-5-hydroxy-6-metoxy-1,4-benzoquinol methylase